MEKVHFEYVVSYFQGIQSFNKVKIVGCCLLFLILFCYGLSPNNNKINKIDLTIERVNSATEEGFILTNKGSFLLPDVTNEVEMEYSILNLLIKNLREATDHQSTIFLYDNIIVGILSESQNIDFKPDFTIREKKIYISSPVLITTTMKKWDADTFRLSVETTDGTFCIYNEYEVKDYYNKAYQILNKYYKMGENLNEIITLKYHKIHDSYECQGEIEDIERGYVE
jgi:hypothetical protein